MAVVALGIGLIGMSSVGRVAGLNTEMYEKQLAPVRDVGAANYQALQHVRRLNNFMVRKDLDLRKGYVKLMDEHAARMRDRFRWRDLARAPR